MKFIIALAIHAILFVGYLKAECLANEWQDETGNCLPCHYSCVTCTGAAANNCLSCSADKIKTFQNQCKCIKSTQFIDADGICQNCFGSCKTCVGPLFFQCTSCDETNEHSLIKAEWDTNGTCECATATQFAIYNEACADCDETCLRCLGDGPAKCIKCATDKAKQPWGRDIPGYCITPCAAKQFRDMTAETADDQICRTCSQLCSDCSGPSASECTGCIDGYFLNAKLGHPGECLEKCTDIHTFRDAAGACVACDDACGECFGIGRNKCYYCTSGYYEIVTDDHFICIESCESGQYRNAITNLCEPCHEACQECKGPENGECLKCKTGLHKTPFYEEVGACLAAENCETKEFRDEEDWCTPCHDTCLRCKGPTAEDCLECDYELSKIPPAVSLKGHCTVPCEDRMNYVDFSDGMCKKCHETCEQCVGPTEADCLICADATKRIYPQIEGYPGQCVTPCLEHKFWNGTHCDDCDGTCDKCMGTGADKCISCPDGSVKSPLQKGIPGVCLVEDCEVGKFKIREPAVCGDCHESCLTCRMVGEFGCLTCELPKVKVPFGADTLGKCMENACTATQYINKDDDYQCADCFISCATCKGGKGCECLTCKTDFYKFPVGRSDTEPGFCVELAAADDFSCETHQIRNMDNGMCEECPSSCVECAGISERKCLKCYEGMIKVPAIDDIPGYCLEPCEQHFYRLNPMGDCLECHASCIECEGPNAADCLSCPDTKLKQPPTPNLIGYCVQDCGVGKYFDVSLKTCADCKPVCQECSGPTADQCLSCNPATSVKIPWSREIPGVCIIGSCPDGTFPTLNWVTQELVCLDCDESCTTCMGPGADQCLTCGVGEAKLPRAGPGKCYTPCPDTTKYREVYGDGLCKPCFSTCLTCLGPLQEDCLTCKPAFTKIYNQGDDTLTSVCKAANWCPEHQYYDGDACQECDGSCKNCKTIGNEHCTECYDGMMKVPWNPFMEGICVPICPMSSAGLAQYYDTTDDLCKPCHQSCGGCAGPNAGDCLICMDQTKTKYPMLVGMRGICVDACTEGMNYYLTDAETEPITCAQCHPNCARCVDNLPAHCLACVANYQKYPPQVERVGTCLEVCTDPTPSYKDATGACQSCHADCASCFGSTEWDCLSCLGTNVKVPKKVGYPGKCFAACPEGQYLNESDYQCHDCHSSCATCTGGYPCQCLTCAADLFKNPLDMAAFDLSLPGLCQTEFYCPLQNQYRTIEDTECQTCHVSCAECFGAGPENCLACKEGLSKYPFHPDLPGYCLTPCPLAYQYPDPDGTCKDCDESCDLCFGGTDVDCLSCRDPTLLKYPLIEGVKGKCEAPCPDGHYRNPLDYTICEECHYTCKTCTGPTLNECLICRDDYIKFNMSKPGICEIPCPDPSNYKDNETLTCKPCHSTCYNCTGPEAHQCLSCKADLVRSIPFKNILVSCLEKCESSVPQFRNVETKVCENCHHSCNACFGPEEYQCLSCPEGMVREYQELGYPTRCLPECKPGYFLILSETAWSCNKCIDDCLECVGPSASECIACPEGKEKIPRFEGPGVCVDKCEFENQFHDADNVCRACHPDCAVCAGPLETDCYKCATNTEGKVKWPPAYDVVGSCVVLDCDEGKYKIADGSCVACGGNCKSCISGEDADCVECIADHVKFPPKFGVPTECVADPCLESGAPSPGCISRIDATICVACNESCASCFHSGSDGCLTCEAGFTKIPSGVGIPGVCVAVCEDGFYRNFTNSSFQICSPCSPNCATCEGPEEWECLSCVPGLFLNKAATYLAVGTCDAFGNCPEGQYGDPADNQCKDCLQSACLFCSGPAITDCLECAEGFEKMPPNPDSLGSCVEPCLEAYTYRDATGACAACHASCKACSGPDDVDCLICKEADVKKYPSLEGVPGKCLAPCEDHKYRSAADDFAACHDCDNSCGNCKGPGPLDCLSCPDGFTKIPFNPYAIGACVAVCADTHKYPAINGSCLECHAGCLTCVGPTLKECLTCPAGMQRLNPDIRFNTSCVQGCEVGKFWNMMNNICDPCHPTCKTCMGETKEECLSCKAHVVNSLVEGTVGICGKQEQGIYCEPHFYINSTDEMTCNGCHSTCNECRGPLETDCTKCYDFFQLFLAETTDLKGKCMQLCDSGFFRNENGVCEQCDESCLECKGPGIANCKSCGVDFVKVPPSPELLGRCVIPCDDGKYRDLDGTCKDCAGECATCSGGGVNECLSCADGKILDSTLYGLPGNCITTTCTSVQFWNGSDCVDCASACLTCSGPEIWDCQSCAAEKVKYPAEIGVSGYCLAACDDHYYRNISDWEFQECKPCHASCMTCEGPGAWQCLTCDTGLFFNGDLQFIGEIPGYCETEGKCPEGFYRVLDPADSCVACHATCLHCNGTAEGDCLECPTYLIKYPPALGVAGKCLEYCQPGQYRDSSSGDCTDCNPVCAECTGGTDTDCLVCAEDPTAVFVKYPLTEGVPGKCIVQGTCATHQYADPDDSWNCKDCKPACATCSGPTSDDCLTCPDNFFKEPRELGVPGVCVEACAEPNKFKDADGVCQDCDSSCLTCIGAGPAKCLTCPAAKIKVPPADNVKGYCVVTCSNSHQYASKLDQQCYECHSACKTCVGNTEFDCLSCYENVEYYLFQNGTRECYTWCNEHQYKDVSGACMECDEMCAECSIAGPANCWSCWEGYVKMPIDPEVVGTCYEKCDAGTFRSADGYCKPCDESCKTCEGPTEQDCLSCAVDGFSKVPSLPKVKGQCLQNTCSSSQYLTASGCQPCSGLCETCVGPDDIECMTCTSPKVKFPFAPAKAGQCVDPCEAGFYRKNETLCAPCHDACVTCVDGTAGGCLTCDLPRVLQANASGIGACVEPCEDGFYRDFASTYKQCEPCHYSCAQCTGPDSTLCKACATGYYFNAQEGTEFGTCDEAGICAEHQFRNSTDECEDCDDSCIECSIIATNCTKCYYEFKLIEGKCLLPCDQALQPQTYRNPDTNECEACHSSCKRCVGPLETDCLICALETQIKQPNIEGQKGQCFDACTSTTEYYDTELSECKPCNETCASCVGPLNTDCLTCISGLIKSDPDPKVASECVALTCTSKQYLSPDGTCKPCSSKCLTCAGYSESDCLTCPSGTTLLIMDGDFKGQCIVPCGTGQFRKSDGTCGTCHENCLNCTGPAVANCLSCKTGLHKNPYEQTEGTCDEYGKCPNINQFRNSQDICQDCHSACAECFGPKESECRICSDDTMVKIPSAYELPGYCAFPCTTEGRYRKTDGTCAPCHESCLVCSGPYAYQCEVCVDTTLVKSPQLVGYPGKCVTPCPNAKQYYNSAMECVDCSDLCATCKGGEDDECLSCVDGYYKLPTGETPGACYEKCATKEYRNTNDNTCLSCHPSCAECVGPNDCDCLECGSGFYKKSPEATYVGKCFKECAAKEFRGYDGKCYACFENCATCTNKTEDVCLTCETGFFLNPPGALIGRCEKKAICYTEHQYRDPTDNLCKNCSDSCVTCFADGDDQCQSCPAGKMKIPLSPDVPGSCLDECPKGQYNSGSACADCAPECQTCTGGGSSDCLICADHNLVKQPPAIQVPGFCSEPCLDGEYISGVGTCGSCDEACLTCIGGTNADCLVCANEKIKYPPGIDTKGSCLTPCEDTKMYRTVEEEDCKPCFKGCLTCSGPLQTDCMTCVSPLVKNTPLGEPGACVKGCSSSHQYPDSDGVCQECDATCLTCKGPGIYSCLTCAAGQQKHPPHVDKLGLCSTCELHQFLDTAGTGYCEECSYACSTCYGTLYQNCLSCNQTELRRLVVTDPSVYPPEKECQCILYYTQEVDPDDELKTICNPCHYSCMKCSTSETENACTECEEAKGRILDAEANTCICNEIGFFTIPDQLQCGICFPTCKKCTDESRFGCLECNGGIDVEPDGSCGCPTGTYLTHEYTCVKPEECGGDLVGIVAAANAENTGNICGERPCPVPFFYNSTTMECKDKCFNGCLTCLDAKISSCQTCIDSYYWTYTGSTGTCAADCEKPMFYVPRSINLKLRKNTCEDRCPDGYGPDQNSEQKCSKCHYLCKTCYKANDKYACKSCESPLSLSNSYGKQEFRNRTMSKVTCQKCSAGYFLAVTPRINDSSVEAATEQCLTKCLKGQYEDKLNRECVNCKDVNCMNCSESYDYCEKCLTDYDLIEGICQPQANQKSCITSGKYIRGTALECVDECGSGYYQNTLTHICEKCDSSCASCSGGEDPNKCKTCTGNRIYYATKHACVYQCPAGTYQSKTATGETTCTECITGCGICTGPAITDCSSCADSYFMITDDDGKLSNCITDCSKNNKNTYGDKSTQTCQPCNSKCQTCINGFATGCLSCYDDDIFSRPSATSAGGTCKVKSEQKSELQEKSASDIASSTADELQQQATEIVAAFTQTISTTDTTTTTTTTDSTSTDATDSSTTDSTDSTKRKQIATTQTREEIEAEKAKKKELLSAVITTAKEMSAKEDLTTDEAKALVEAVKCSVKPEVSVTMVTASGEKVESTAIADDDSEEVARKFDKDESIAVCDTLTNVVDKIDVTADEEVTQNIFEAASDVLKQTATLQQDKKVAKGTATSIDDSTDETTQENIKEDMEVVKKVVEFCDNLSNQIKKKLTPGKSMKFKTTEMKLEVGKYSTGDKNQLKESLISTLSFQETTATTTTNAETTTTTTNADTTTTDATTATNTDATTTDATTTTTDDSDPNRQINHPEIVIKDELVDHLSNELDKLKEEGKDVDSLTVKKASYDLDINTLSKNTSNATEAATANSDFTRASHLQQFGFELEDGTKVDISDLADEAQFEIQFDYIADEDSSFSCVYWNEETKEYDSAGVQLDQETKTCKSKHLTDFIVKKTKKNNKHVFNFGIFAVVIPIALCLFLFSLWFLRNRKHSVSSFGTIGSGEINFTTLSPFVSIWKAKTVPEALNRITHFACYLITIMMFLVLFFRDSVDVDNNFDKLLVAGLVFGLSFAIILKYFLGIIKTQTKLYPWVYFVVSIAYFTACSGITIWRMNQLSKDEAWNWFHATYLVLIFDFVILDTLIIVALRMGLSKKWRKLHVFLSHGGFLAIPKVEQITVKEIKGNPVLDLERGSNSSRPNSPDKFISRDVVVVDNLAEGEQLGSRPLSKAGEQFPSRPQSKAGEHFASRPQSKAGFLQSKS